ncbi:RNA methyltransferase [Coralliovum pocilloporae]|uniref:RNA methyltransferase n=1 Tax=Coralliovum pocilloporae TaxID=3066369 RepID=UPI003307AA78
MAQPVSPSGLTKSPAIILVEPQMGENIGAAARAMANFGLVDLRLVNPRDGWPNERAIASASGATHITDRTRVYDTTEEAVADLSFVMATTRRERDMLKVVRGPVEATSILAGYEQAGSRTGLLFGRERWGLTNEEVALADEIVTLPVDPKFASLNIAQAVLVMSYEWRKVVLGEEEVTPFSTPDAIQAAPKADLIRMFEHLERALDAVNFFRPPEKKPSIVRNLRTMLQRAQFSEQEIRTLRGVIAALEKRETRPSAQKSDESAD